MSKHRQWALDLELEKQLFNQKLKNMLSEKCKSYLFWGKWLESWGKGNKDRWNNEELCNQKTGTMFGMASNIRNN